MSSNVLRNVGGQGASIQHGTTKISSLNLPVTWPTRNLGRTRATNKGGGKT